MLLIWLITVDVNLGPLAEVVFPLGSYFLSSPSPSVLFRRNHCARPILQMWGCTLHLLGVDYLHKLFGILLCRKLFALSYLFPMIYLYQNRIMDIYFIL